MRCEKTDLLVDECACSDCRPDLKPQTKPPEGLSLVGLALWSPDE